MRYFAEPTDTTGDSTVNTVGSNTTATTGKIISVDWVVDEGSLSSWLNALPRPRVGVQVSKKNLVVGSRILREVEKCSVSPRSVRENECDSNSPFPAPVILCDSDRCCIDWVAVHHSGSQWILKQSFSCPRLGSVAGNKLGNGCRIAQYVEPLDSPRFSFGVPSPGSCEVKKSVLEPRDLIRAYSDIHLAVGVDYFPVCGKIRGFIEEILGAKVSAWEYPGPPDSAYSSSSLILVVSRNKGFQTYFRESGPLSVALDIDDLSSHSAFLKRMKEAVPGAGERKRRMLVQKLALAEKIKHAGTIGIVTANATDAYISRVLAAYIDAHGKKYYQFYINGLKPNKLGSYIGIDVFVVVQCPFSSFEFEGNITVARAYDLLLALSPEWDGAYTLCQETAIARIRADLERKKREEKTTVITDTEPEQKTKDPTRNTPSTILAPRSIVNSLKIPRGPGSVCTAEQAAAYFRTGEYIKSISAPTIPESHSGPSKMVQGYSGIPTNYTKGN